MHADTSSAHISRAGMAGPIRAMGILLGIITRPYGSGG
jgi:hypothetical protein